MLLTGLTVASDRSWIEEMSIAVLQITRQSDNCLIESWIDLAVMLQHVISDAHLSSHTLPMPKITESTWRMYDDDREGRKCLVC